MSDSVVELKARVDMYQAQYAATDKLWAYFSTVSLALIAYTVSSEKVTRVFPEGVVVVAAYLAFCAGNFSALKASQRQLVALAALVHKAGADFGVTDKSFPVFPVRRVTNFYWLVVCVIVGVSLGLAAIR